MPIAAQEIELPEPAALSLDQWNNLLYAHYFTAGQSQVRTPVSRLHVSGKELAVAIMAAGHSVESVRTAFVECIKKCIGNRSLAADASRRREAWFRTCDGVPAYLSHLLLTCMVVNDLAEDLHEMGDFRKRLSSVLGGANHSQLEPLRALWEEFAAWTAIQELRNDRRDKRLQLPAIPDSGYHSIIGYPIRLSVPSRRDQETLSALFQRAGLQGRELEAYEVVTLFNQHFARFSPQFQDLYRDFTSKRTQLPLSALTQLTFWNIVREVALLRKNELDTKPQSLKTRLELEDEDGCFWLSLTCDRELQQGTLKTFPLPAVRETAYRFILLTADGGAPYDDKLAFSEQGNNSELDLALEGITASFGNGILLFQEIDDHVSVLIENLPLTGTLRALVSSKLSSDLGLALAGKQSQHSVRRSTHSGWFEWRGLAAELLRHPDVRLYPSLARIECLRPVLTPANIVIRGGIRIGSSFVALLSSLPSFQIDDADHLDWIHPGEPARAMQKLGPEGTWRFGVNSAASELVGSHRIRAFYKDVMIAERTVSFIEGSFTTQYKSPQNEDRWLIEERSIDLKFLSEVVFPDSPVSRRLPDHSVGSPSPLHIEESEARHSDTLDEFIITLACIFEAQRGIAEGPLVQAFMSALGIYGAELWAVIRAWTEAGFLDVLSDARWRARVYFPRKPRLVYVHRGNKNWGVLTGLIPRFLLTRFRNVCSSLGLKLSARASFSSHVPSIYECEVETVDQVIHLSQELEIGHLGKSSLSDYQGATVRKLAEEYSTPIHDSWPSFRSWDWNRKMFLARADSAERAGVSLTWCRRDDGPDRFKVHRDGEQLWWTRSRTWAVLAAYTLAGEMPFERLEALTIEAWGDSVYLPLPVARAIALSARTLPGPVKTTERIVYRYEFANSRERERVLEALWPGSSPNSPSRPQEVDAAVTILLSQQGASSMPIPSELRYSLALLSGTSLISSSTLIAMSALPRLYALRRLLQERKCQWL